MIEVWHNRRHREQAGVLIERLEAGGRNARANNPGAFVAEQVDTDVEKAYHDGTDLRVPALYATHAIPCELIPGTKEHAGHTTDTLARAMAGPPAGVS